MLSRLCGPVFVLAGALHFAKPKMYETIMPPWLPRHRELVYASGVAEMVGGAGLMTERLRRPAGWWLIATLIAVFPANVHMALNAAEFKVPGGQAALIGRLPFQLVFIAWVRGAMRRANG
jgi:uncharacterized membrane protein